MWPSDRSPRRAASACRSNKYTVRWCRCTTPARPRLNASVRKIGHVTTWQAMPKCSSTSLSNLNGSSPQRSHLLTNVKIGSRRRLHTSKSCCVRSSTPLRLSSNMTAASAAMSVRSVSSEKSAWPGVSSKLSICPLYSNCMALEVTEMPRSRSNAIQSEVTCRSARRPLTVPAKWIAPPYSRSFSVSVVLPASGWEMMAKVRRRAASRAMVDSGACTCGI